MWREPAIPRRGCDWKEGHGAPSLLQLSLMPTDKDHRSTQNYQPQSCAHLMYNKRCIEESDKYRVKMTYMPLFDQWCHLQSSKKVCCEGLSVPMSLGRVAVCRPSAEVTSKGGEKLRGEKFWDGERMNALHRTCARARAPAVHRPRACTRRRCRDIIQSISENAYPLGMAEIGAGNRYFQLLPPLLSCYIKK